MNTYLRIKQMRNYQKFFTKMLKKQENINNEKTFRDRGSGFGIRIIGARDDPGMKNKMFASNKPGMIQG